MEVGDESTAPARASRSLQLKKLVIRSLLQAGGDLPDRLVAAFLSLAHADTVV
jgi:hypothetical protein